MTPANDLLERPDHCAKFSQPILDSIAASLERLDPDRTWTVLDPFAGIGRIHLIANGRPTIASELQYRWAHQGGPRSLVADALRLPFASHSIDCVITSPCYGNRMADLYDGQGQCKKCHGHPADLFGETCDRCGGEGHDNSKRYTYRISHGAPLHPRSSAGLQWGKHYRTFHRLAWAEVTRVLRPYDPVDQRGGVLILNISDHLRKKGKRQERQHVAAWHHNHLAGRGYDIVDLDDVETDRSRNGANHDARVPHEHVITYHAPAA